MKTRKNQIHGGRLDGMPSRCKGCPCITTGMIVACGVLFFITPEAIFDGFAYQPFADCGLPRLMLTTAIGVVFHADFSHLVANMLCLLVLGILLENRLGSWRFLTVMMLGSLLANLVGLNLMLSRVNLGEGICNFQELSWPPAGASGAVAGLMGLGVIPGGNAPVWQRRLFPPHGGGVSFLLIGIAVMMGLWGGRLLVGPASMIDDRGHLAAFLGGLVLALVFRLLDDVPGLPQARPGPGSPPVAGKGRINLRGSVPKGFRAGYGVRCTSG